MALLSRQFSVKSFSFDKIRANLTNNTFIKSRFTILVSMVTGIISLIYLVIAMNKGLKIHDEGAIVYGATRILKGDILYKDFFDIYAPGQFYLFAALYHMFGISLLVGRIYSTLILLAIPLVVFVIVKRIENTKIATISWALSMIWLSSFSFFCSPVPPVVLLSLLSCLSIVYFVDRRRAKYLLISGLFAGLASVFRHDIGLYVFAAHTIFITLFTTLGDGPGLKEPLLTARLLGERLVVYMAGVTIIVLPVGLYFLANVPIRTLIEDLLIWPVMKFPKFFEIPYPLPGLETMFFWFPPLIYLTTLGYITHGVYRKKIDRNDPKLWYLLLFFLIGVFFFNQAAMRSDISHLFPTFFPAIIILVIFAEKCRDEMEDSVWLKMPRPKWRLYASVVVVITILSFVQPFRYQIIKLKTFLDGHNFVFMKARRAKGIMLKTEEAGYDKALQYIQDEVGKNEKIFVGNMRHDRLVVGDIMFYFLSERHSATKYHVLGPGLTTTEIIQDRIINNIFENNVKYIILRSIDNREPNMGGISSNVYNLDKYIEKNFEVVKSFKGNFGGLTILRRVM